MGKNILGEPRRGGEIWTRAENAGAKLRTVGKKIGARFRRRRKGGENHLWQEAFSGENVRPKFRPYYIFSHSILYPLGCPAMIKPKSPPGKLPSPFVLTENNIS